jgi:Flp pilus assembly protein TadD
MLCRWRFAAIRGVGWVALSWQGTDLLNTGQYAEARPALERAKSLNPFDSGAGCGLKAVELERSDEHQMDDAIREFPNCAYLKVLRGDRKYLVGDLTGALADYQEAVRHEPRLAEAHFNMGRVLDLQDKPDSALPEYEQALKLSPGTARYRHNLADLYFRREEYDKAIEQYGLMGEFPLAALELAKIYRLQGRLEEARGRGEDAIRWLKAPAVQSAELKSGWAFEVSPEKHLRLGPLVEKQCYADLELAMTRFLAGDEGPTATTATAALERCSSRRTELTAILSWELHRLGSENPTFGERSDKFARQFFPSH